MKDNLQYILPLVVNVSRYFLFAGIPFLIFYILFPKVFRKNKIQSRLAKRMDYIREILHSMQTTLILAGVGLVLLNSPLRNHTKIYTDISEYSLWWIPASIILSLILHDTYFYWMHRTVHHPNLFKYIHLTHHKSVNPSPWAAYSFDFIEGILEAMIAPIILFLIPMHPISLFLFAILSFTINVYGHLGYEIAPKWFRSSFLFEVLNTSTHHNIHHHKFNKNYALYFRFWDRIMDTEHPEYVMEYDKIQERRFNSNSTFMFSLKGVFSVILAITASIIMISFTSQKGIEGKWKDDIGGGVILVYEKDGLYFGELISADNPEEDKKIKEHGKVVIMKNFKKESTNNYCCGTIFQPRKKRTISATLVLENQDTLRINGRYGVFKRSRIWKRI